MATEPGQEKIAKKALIADDNDNEREALTQLVRAENYEVIPARSGREALKHLENNDFDVVFIDIIMPGMHGLDLLKRVKEIRPKLPILVLAEAREQTWADRALSLGALDYVIKPAEAREVRRVLGWITRLKTPEPDAPEKPPVEPAEDTRRQKSLEIQKEMFRILSEGSEIGRIYLDLSEWVREMTGSETALIYLEDGAGAFTLTAGWGPAGEIRAEQTLNHGQGLLGWALDSREGIILKEPRNNPRFDPEVDQKQLSSLTDLILVPILQRGRCLGLLVAANCRNPSGFGQGDLDPMSTIALGLSVVLRIDWLHKNIELRIDELAEAESQTQRLKKALLKSDQERRSALEELKKIRSAPERKG
ncbi:MAG: response regulator [Proteobacteria bacterium]|nr:response regulator [Pseudomonadota bacterium]